MKRIIFKTVALILTLTHLFTVCLHDISFAAEKDSSDPAPSEKPVHAEFVPNDKIKSTASPLNLSTISSQSSVPPVTIQAAMGFNASVLQLFQNDIFTGRAVMSIPIAVPAGKRGVQPNITVGYSSGSGNGILGVGWLLELGSIERSTKKGMLKYDATDTFIFTSGGSQVELVNIGTNEYRAEIEGAFMKFYFDGSSWQVKDKSGTTFIFGQDANHRLESSGKIFKWCLQTVTDICTNYMTIDYMKDGGQVYPYEIKYTGNTALGLQPVNLIKFSYSDRTDKIVSYRSAFRVETNKILSDITIYANSQRLRKYHFVYEDNSAGIRSLLKSLIQYGSDDSVSLPAVSFEYKPLEAGWEPATASLPAESQLGPFTYLADVNNDGLVDILRHYYVGDYRFVRHSFLGKRDGSWSEVSTWYPPSFGWPAETLRDDGVRLVDVNGDGWVDMVQHLHSDGCNGCCINTAYINNKRDGWYQDNSWRMPEDVYVIYNHHVDVPMEWREYMGVVFVDVNADGYVDILRARGGERYAYINTHSGWQRDATWAMPDGDLSDGSTQFGDLNADGLIDFMILKDSTRLAYLNTGSGWVREPAFDPPAGNFSDGSTQLIDINEDGLSDLVIASGSEKRTFLNIAYKGSHWQANSNLALPEGNFQNYSTRLNDTRGKNTPDVLFNPSDERRVYVNKAKNSDYLAGVSNGLGGTVSINYKSSVQYDNTGEDGISDLPFAIQTIEAVTLNDGRGSQYTTRYEYKDGLFDFTEREFRGFGYVKVTDTEGNYTESYFKQDNIFKGKLDKQATYDASGNPYTRTENTWYWVQPYSGVFFPYLESAISYTYNGEPANPRRTKTYMEYDRYGNTIKTIDYGDMDISQDERQAFIDYAYNTSDYIVGLPKHSKVTDAADSSGKTVSEKWLYYDNHTNFDDLPAKGLLTQVVSWGYNSLTAVTDNAVVKYSYDAWGNLSSTTDPLGHTTTTGYDSIYHIFPVTVTNASGHTVKTVYYGVNEPSGDSIAGFGLFGQVKYQEDPNGVKTYNIYDKLSRLVKVIGPNDNESYAGMLYRYYLDTQPVKITKEVKSNINTPPEYLTIYQFYDGMSRLIQTKSPAEDSPQGGQRRQIISDIVKFDQRGQVKEKYLSYFVNESADYLTPAYTTPHATFGYDALGRIIKTTNPDSTYSTINYSNTKNTVIDENGHKKISYFDAYARITKVEEYLGSDGRCAQYPLQQYSLYSTTQYSYDNLNNLTKVTDNQGNITQIWYDSLSRKVKMDDPDMGIWHYEYDKVGNLKKQTDTKTQVLEFKYDELNRLTIKQGLSPQGTVPVTLATYYYDSGTNGIGRLSKITDLSGSTEFFYDNLGREIKSVKTITGSGSYTVERTYDALDRLVTLKYPDGEVLTYKYNPQGIQNVKGPSSTYVADIDYLPTGQISRVQYGNGTETNYAYDEKTLRLTNLTTQASSGKIQDLNYQFDNRGNVRNITDYKNTGNQSFLYDALDRLVQASGSYGSFTYDYDSIGNMLNKEGQNLVYGKAGKLPHAVTQVGSNPIGYDANGNMISKGDFSLSYDIENRLNKIEDKSISATLPPTVVPLTLNPGWNFISFPVMPQDAKITAVLSSIAGKYNQVSRYNPGAKAFEHFVGNSKYDQFDTFEYGKGYQIYITSATPVTLTLRGSLPENIQFIALKSGPNLISNPKTVETAVEQALLGIKLGLDFSRILYYDKSQNKFLEYSQAKKEFTTLKPGVSYYLYCLQDVTWAIKPALATLTFTYDGDGGRVKKIAGSSSTTYIGSLFEIDSSGRATKHIFAGANRVCTKGLSLNYYHSDHLGSSNVITDGDGNQIQYCEYTPYGTVARNEQGLSPQGTVPVKHLFTGKELDNTGLYFYGARYYDPEIGRFITADTIVQTPYDPQSLNRYSYCRNNPINYVDPTGHSWWSKFWKQVSGFVGAAVGVALGFINPFLGMFAYSAIAASGQGGNFGSNFGINFASSLAGFVVGAGAGKLASSFFKGDFWPGMIGSALGGAAGGAATAGMLGGDAGMGALAGLAGGTISYTGGFVWPLGADAVAGGVSSVIMGGEFGEGAAQGAYYNMAETVGGILAPMQKFSAENAKEGDIAYFQTDSLVGLGISLFEGGPFSHVGIVTDKGLASTNFGDNSGYKELADYNGRGAYVSTKYRGNRNVIKAAIALGDITPKIKYGFWPGQKVCSTITASALNKAGYGGWYGIGPNSQLNVIGTYGED